MNNQKDTPETAHFLRDITTVAGLAYFQTTCVWCGAHHYARVLANVAPWERTHRCQSIVDARASPALR